MITPVCYNNIITFTSKASRLKKRQARQQMIQEDSDNYQIKLPKSFLIKTPPKTTNKPIWFENSEELKIFLDKQGYRFPEKIIQAFETNSKGTNVYLDACNNSKRYWEYGHWKDSYTRDNSYDLDPKLLDIYAKYPKGAKYILSKTYFSDIDPVFTRNGAALSTYIGEQLLEYIPICNTDEDIKVFEEFNTDKDISSSYINHGHNAPVSLYKSYKENPEKFKEFAKLYRGYANIAQPVYDGFLENKEGAICLADKFNLLSTISCAIKSNPIERNTYLELLKDIINENTDNIEKLNRLAYVQHGLEYYPLMESADDFIKIMKCKKTCPEVIDTLLDSEVHGIGDMEVEDMISLIENHKDKIKPLSEKIHKFSLAQIKEIIDIVNQ